MTVFARGLAALALAFALAFALAWAVPHASADEARVKEITATLKKCRDLIERGRDSDARELLTPVISDASTPTELMALAFFFRGVANDRLKEPQAALADLGNALWFGNLPEPLKAQAHVRRASSMMQLGRTEDARLEVEMAQKLSPSDPAIAQAAEAIGRETTHQAAAAPQTSQIAKSEDRITPLTDEPLSVAPSIETTAALPKNTPKPTGFGIQLAAVGDKSAAENEWQRIISTYGDLLDGLEARYLKRGNLTKLQVGPLPSYQASVALCTKLQQRGQDCFAVTP